MLTSSLFAVVLCKPLFLFPSASYLMAQALTTIAALSVTMVNVVLGMAMVKLVEFERHNSASEVRASIPTSASCSSFCTLTAPWRAGTH